MGYTSVLIKLFTCKSIMLGSRQDSRFKHREPINVILKDNILASSKGKT